MSKVARRTIRRLKLEPYSRAILARGLKARKADDDGEEYEGLERAMEYAGVVGAELADMLTAVNEKVKAIEPRVPAQHTFGGDGLQNFIRDHQEELERLSHQVENTGGKGAFTQWAHCEFIVGFETICLANTHQANGGFF